MHAKDLLPMHEVPRRWFNPSTISAYLVHVHQLIKMRVPPSISIATLLLQRKSMVMPILLKLQSI